VGAGGAGAFDVLECLAQLGEPLVGVLADEAYAPGEGVAAAAGHSGLDQRVEHPALRLASRNRPICPEAAAARSVSEASAPTAGGGSVPTTVISSRS
jgi:hypothetical protein